MDSGLKDSTDSTKILYNLYIVSDAPIFAPKDCSMIFSLGATINSKYTTNLVSIDFNDNFNTSLTEVFCGSDLNSNEGMFYRCNKIEKLDLSGFNTKKKTNMRGMFKSCTNLSDLNLNSFNTSKVLFMQNLFLGCSKIESIELSNFNTSKVADMRNMFYSCSSLTILGLNSFNTSKVYTMESMFEGCSLLTNLYLSSFNTSNVTNVAHMFEGCEKIRVEINILNSDCTYSYMFSGALTDPDAYVILGYTTDTQATAEAMRGTVNIGYLYKITLKQI